MSSDDEIIKRKLYYDGLKQVIEHPIPENDAKDIDDLLQEGDADTEVTETLRMWKEVAAPVCNAIVFVHNNRFLLDEKETIINEDAGTPFMPSDEIFKTLKTLLKATVMEFLSVLQISSGDKKELLDRVEHDDKDGFRSLLEQSRCDTTALARLCAYCWDDSFTAKNIEDSDLSYLLDYMASRLKNSDITDDKTMLDAVEQWQPSSELIDSDDSDETLDRYMSDYRRFLETELSVVLHYYWDFYDEFLLKERNLIEPILDHPLAVDLVNRIWKDYETALIGGPFSLPDDFFHSKCTADDTEHLHVKLFVEDEGAELFTEFINYVAEKGYIEDSPAVKSLFAYRLTGYYRPEGDLPHIVWSGRNGKSYELIYILRYLCDRGDYKKMRRFFEGPEWVKEKDSSYAHSADTEFRRKMSELYPGVCEFRK